MTGFQEVATAVEAMKLGAYDYLTKPTKIEELDVLVRKAAEKGQLLRDNVALRARAPGAGPFGGIITRSPKMQEILRMVDRVAPTESSVLLLGESGTGKELVARAIHERSPRTERPFVPIHCGALPREVLESELFGHEKGAFTGAVASKPGLIELADGGTLLLDEIGDMEPDSQVKLLRVLETGMFFRVGGTRPRRVDVRLVAATNRDLTAAMRSGQFREDLFYRINTITVLLPPLRERPEDVRAARPALPGDERQLRAQATEPGDPRRPGRLRLAGQRPRAAARDPAGRHPLQGRRDHARRLATRDCGPARRRPDHRDGDDGRFHLRGADPGSHGTAAHREHAAPGRRAPRQGGGGAGYRPQDALPEDPRLPDQHGRDRLRAARFVPD